MNWKIEQRDAEEERWGGGYTKEWVVTDGPVAFRCESEEAAKWLQFTLTGHAFPEDIGDFLEMRAHLLRTEEILRTPHREVTRTGDGELLEVVPLPVVADGEPEVGFDDLKGRTAVCDIEEVASVAAAAAAIAAERNKNDRRTVMLLEALNELMNRAHPAHVADDLLREKLIFAREKAQTTISRISK